MGAYSPICVFLAFSDTRERMWTWHCPHFNKYVNIYHLSNKANAAPRVLPSEHVSYISVCDNQIAFACRGLHCGCTRKKFITRYWRQTLLRYFISNQAGPHISEPRMTKGPLLRGIWKPWYWRWSGNLKITRTLPVAEQSISYASRHHFLISWAHILIRVVA